MKQFVLGVILTITFPLCAQDQLRRQAVRVPDAASAVAIARRAAMKRYGKAQISREEPLTAVMHEGVWLVTGTLCCSNGKGGRTCEDGRCVGGVVAVEVRQTDGEVLSIKHTL